MQDVEIIEDDCDAGSLYLYIDGQSLTEGKNGSGASNAAEIPPKYRSQRLRFTSTVFSNPAFCLVLCSSFSAHSNRVALPPVHRYPVMISVVVGDMLLLTAVVPFPRLPRSSRSAKQQAWLNSDGERGSDDDDQSPLTFGEEQREGHEDPEDQEDQEDPLQAPRRKSSVSPTQKRKISPDARPWLLKLSPQWIDFKRRRSSLLSLHFSNGSRIPRSTSISRSTSTQSKLGRVGSVAHVRPRTASTGSRTLSEQLKTLYGATGLASRNRSPAKNLPSCTEIDYKAAANELGADQDDDGGGRSRTPSFSGAPKSSRYPQDERYGEVRATAGLGRHRRSSGTWALDHSTHDSSFSGFSSEIDGSKSSIDVHNFLEESVGSEDEGSLDGAEGVRGDGPYYHGGIGDGRNNDGSCNDLDAQDIRFLSDGKKLRDVLLAVEDLHFSERDFADVSSMAVSHTKSCRV